MSPVCTPSKRGLQHALSTHQASLREGGSSMSDELPVPFNGLAGALLPEEGWEVLSH
jgi:hypothetical protein